MFTRRTVLGAVAATAWLTEAAHARPRPAPAADDEDFWREVALAFTLDRTMINLNNGGCSPTPRVVQEALVRYLEWSNQGPPFYMWRELEPGVEAVRREVAREAGVDPEELAITRNASEALQIAQLGLALQPGDEVLTTSDDPTQSCAIGTVGIDGLEPGKIVEHLLSRWRIIATPIVHPRFAGVRVTPNVYTTLQEIDLFAQVMREVADHGC